MQLILVICLCGKSRGADNLIIRTYMEKISQGLGAHGERDNGKNYEELGEWGAERKSDLEGGPGDSHPSNLERNDSTSKRLNNSRSFQGI